MGAEARGFKIGDRVFSTQREYVCGCCTMCRTDREALCADLRFLGQEAMGGNAEFVNVHGRQSCASCPTISRFEAGSIVGCPVGTSYNAVIDTGDVRPGERVLLTGMGGLGIHAVQIARACGAYVIAATRSAEKAKAIEESRRRLRRGRRRRPLRPRRARGDRRTRRRRGHRHSRQRRLPRDPPLCCSRRAASCWLAK